MDCSVHLISKYIIDKHDAAVEKTVYHFTVRQEFVVKNSCKLQNKTFNQQNFRVLKHETRLPKTWLKVV